MNVINRNSKIGRSSYNKNNNNVGKNRHISKNNSKKQYTKKQDVKKKDTKKNINLKRSQYYIDKDQDMYPKAVFSIMSDAEMKKIARYNEEKKRNEEKIIKKKKNIIYKAYIFSTFNNTIITITNISGKTLLWCASGYVGFKGSKKSTPFAAQTSAFNIGRRAIELGIREIEIYVKGPGPGRELAIKSLNSIGLKIIKLVDTTPIPHNGCKPPKRRRV